MKILYALILISFSQQLLAQKYLLDEDVNQDTVIPKFGYKRKYDMANYSAYGFAGGPSSHHPPSEIKYFNSWQFREGFWGRIKLNRWYAAGSYLEYSRDEYRLKTPLIIDSINNSKTNWTKQVNNNVVLGLFNRISLKPEKFYIDFGVYYAYDFLPKVITKIKPSNGNFQSKRTIYNKPSFMNKHNYGLDLRISYGSLALYARYRYTGLYKNYNFDLPKFSIGLMVDFKD